MDPVPGGPVSQRDQVFSGSPNGVLVTEATDLQPGRTLDVGCAEGADALWLARHGWQVTAVDVFQPRCDALLARTWKAAWCGPAPT